MIYAISGDKATIAKLEKTSLVSESLWERQNLEEWILKEPSILSEPLHESAFLIITSELAGVTTSADRLDILALDKKGKLVVVELKRDVATSYPDLQAIRYASQYASMHVSELIQIYSMAHQLTPDEAKKCLLDFVELENPDEWELDSKPRVVLVAQGFGKEIVTSVIWLRSFGVDISCISLELYRYQDQLYLTSSPIWPQPEVETVRMSIERKGEQEQESVKQRSPEILRALFDAKILRNGDELDFIGLNQEQDQAAEPAADDLRATVLDSGELRVKVIWKSDGQQYPITSLSRIILEKYGSRRKSGVGGAWYWTLAGLSDDWGSLGHILESYRNGDISSREDIFPSK